MTEHIEVFATPRMGLRREDCDFYHTMEIPGVGLVEGQWDLRRGVDAYLGGVDLNNRRVLEIGPASEVLTFEMEKRGADVTAIEVKEDPGWGLCALSKLHPRARSWPSTRAYAALEKLVVVQSSSIQIPRKAHFTRTSMISLARLGSSMLQLWEPYCFTRAPPLQILEQCARRADTLVITDMYSPELEGSPFCQLLPSAGTDNWHTWWKFSTDFFTQFLGVMQFTSVTTTHEQQPHQGRPFCFLLSSHRERRQRMGAQIFIGLTNR